MKELLNDGKIPLVPYTRYKGKKGSYKPWEFIYDEGKTCFICPQGCQLQHTTTDRNGKRTYRNTQKDCQNRPCWEACGANAKDKHGMLFTHRRGLARVSAWVRLKFAALNLKKLALWWASQSLLHGLFCCISSFFLPFP